MLSKKVDTLSKAMEVEAKKMRREVIVMEKEVAAMKVDKDQDRRTRRPSMSKEPVHSSSQRMTGRLVNSALKWAPLLYRLPQEWTSTNDVGCLWQYVLPQVVSPGTLDICRC